MPQIINTNISSINAQRNLNKSQGALQTSLQRLSSGLRINSAKDDAAGLAISNRFTTQVRGLNVAIRNANDGISFAQTTESALEEIATALQRMRDLGVQAANDTNSQSDRLSLQAEVTQLVAEIERIAQTTTFNNRAVLDGSNATLSFQIGANANQTVSVSGVNARTSALGSQPGMVQSTGNRVDYASAGDAGTQGVQESGGLALTDDLSDFTIRLDNIAVADAVNITDTVYGGNISTVATTNLLDRFDDNYGGGLAKAIAERVNAIRIRGEESLQGVYATASTSFRGSDLDTLDYNGTVDNTNAPDTNVGQGVLENGDLTINGVDVGPVTFQINDASGTLVNAINAKSNITGVAATVDKNGELVLTAEDGRDIVVSTSSAGVTNDLFGGGDELAIDRFDDDLTDLRVTGRITVTGQDTLNFTGANNSDLGLDTAGLAATGSEDNIQAVGTIANADVTTRESANTLIESVDSALDQINSIRGELGAIQNRFESTIRNLSSISESLAAANSRILDADFALETAKLSKNQVLQQAGISVLAQANGLPQQVLSLLQG